MAHHRFPPTEGRGALDAAVELAPAERQWHYAQAVAEYRRFVTDHTVSFIGHPRQALWVDRGVHVQINPELHLLVDGHPLVVKLYLRSPATQALSSDTADALTHLLDRTHGHLGLPVVFDVFRGRAFEPPRVATQAVARLRAEAAALAGLWSELDGQAPTEELPTVPAA